MSGFVCHSWLLDPQLGEYLRPDSNIMRFQQRFDVLPWLPTEDITEGDRELMRIGLHLAVPASGTVGRVDREPVCTFDVRDLRGYGTRLSLDPASFVGSRSVGGPEAAERQAPQL